jgi:hypothetical protein
VYWFGVCVRGFCWVLIVSFFGLIVLQLRIFFLVVVEDPVDESVLHGLVGTHKVIPIQIFHHLILRLTRHHTVHFDQIVPYAQNLTGLYLDVLRLTLGAPHGLVDHGPTAGQGQSFPLTTGRQDETGHTRGQTEIDGDDLALDVLHTIVNGQTGNDGSAGTVNVQVNGLVRIFIVEIEHHPDHLIGQFVVNLTAQKDDALPVQTVVNVDPVLF